MISVDSRHTDSRLLVKVSAFPFMPKGLEPTPRCPRCGHNEKPELHGEYGNTDEVIWTHICQKCRFDGNGFWWVDLSAPARFANLDTRFDALPWALQALHPEAAGYSVISTSVGVVRSILLLDKPRFCGFPHPLLALVNDVDRGTQFVHGAPIQYVSVHTSTLSNHEVERALVAAALNARSSK